MAAQQDYLHGMTNKYEQILSYRFSGAVFRKCHGQTETITMSLRCRAAGDAK